jgi:hypothetical protein
MRVAGKMMLFGAALLLVAYVAAPAQQPKGGGGFGGFGGGQQDITSLLRNASVKKEIKLTDEQLEKVPAAVMKALGEVLSAEQLTRLKQIELQQRGPQALKDTQVQTALKLSGEQKENVNTILDESAKEQRELMKEAQGGNFQGLREKMLTLRKETNEKLMNVLSSDQRKNWTAMLGDDFKIEFGGFGGGKGKGKFKKKDIQ